MGRMQRWLNAKDVFSMNKQIKATGKHVLLIDDVLTTGATIEACAKALLTAPNIQVSIATVAYAEQ